MASKKDISPAENNKGIADDFDVASWCAATALTPEDEGTEQDAQHEEQERLLKKLRHQGAKCFIDIRRQLGPYEARAMLEELLESPLAELPKPDQTQPLSEREWKLLADVDAAPSRRDRSYKIARAEARRSGKKVPRQKEDVKEEFANERGIKVASVKRELARYRKDIGYIAGKWFDKKRREG